MTRRPRGAAADASRRWALQRLSRLAAGTLAALATRAGADAALPAIAQPATPGPAAFAARAEAMRQLAIARGDQPYGAVVVCDGRIVGEGVSAVITNADPTAHAERQAIRDAQRRTGSLDLSGCVLYGTSRACPLCEAAARDARVARMAYGSSAIDAGAPGGAGR
jgi:tRNA(adenine34) deaminase